jgi:hypothetical protein
VPVLNLSPASLRTSAWTLGVSWSRRFFLRRAASLLKISESPSFSFS